MVENGYGVEAMVPMMAASIAPGSAAQIDLNKRVDITELVGAVTAPTLIVAGLEDRWVDISHSRGDTRGSDARRTRRIAR